MTLLLSGRPVALGGQRGFSVTRLLPDRDLRRIGAWCFLDAYGPLTASMRVPPHPHTGLQTVTWLVRGSVEHRDTLGNAVTITPGQLNLMTAGRGIAHSEESPSALIHGVQLWVALPHAARDRAPAFAHHADLPMVTEGALTSTVLVGTFAGVTSPAAAYSPLVAAELRLSGPAAIPLTPDFEYGVVTLAGAASVDGVALPPEQVLYLGAGRSSVRLTGSPDARLLLLGGAPFEERLVMWWNFVGREHDEIVQMRADWQDATPRFGRVPGFDGDPLPAPPMPTARLLPR